jgi:hypothetical protein
MKMNNKGGQNEKQKREKAQFFDFGFLRLRARGYPDKTFREYFI